MVWTKVASALEGLNLIRSIFVWGKIYKPCNALYLSSSPQALRQVAVEAGPRHVHGECELQDCMGPW